MPVRPPAPPGRTHKKIGAGAAGKASGVHHPPNNQHVERLKTQKKAIDAKIRHGPNGA
jgi:hypothetical protein